MGVHHLPIVQTLKRLTQAHPGLYYMQVCMPVCGSCNINFVCVLCSLQQSLAAQTVIQCRGYSCKTVAGPAIPWSRCASIMRSRTFEGHVYKEHWL